MPNQPQPQQTNQLSHADTRATLGNLTHIMSHLLPQQQTQQTAQNATQPEPPQNQETGTDLQTQMQGLESRIFDELGVLKQEIQKVSGQDTTKVLEDLKKQIDTALSSNE